MKAVRATLITLAMLAGVWTLLGLIAVIAGVLPDLPDVDPDVEPETVADAGPTPDAMAPVDAGIDAPDPEADANVPEPVLVPSAHPALRFRVCDYPTSIAHSLDWSFVTGELLASGPPEIVVGCADRYVVIGIASGPTGMMGMRLAELTLESTREVEKHTARAAIADITGDGKEDLLLPFFFESDGGGSRGGRLVLWPRAESGFGRLRTIGQHTFQNATPVDLDGRGGVDFVVVDRGRPWASEMGAIRFYQGGPQPRQRAQSETGISPRNAVVVDIDQDGEKDVITSSSGFSNANTRHTAAIHVLRRTGSFQFDHTEVAADGHWGLIAGDLDDDGNQDVVIGGSNGLAALYARSRADLEGLALETLAAGQGAPVPMAVADVDGDGLNDLIVEDQGGLSWLARTTTGYRGARSYDANDVAGAALIQVDGVPVLVWAILEAGRLDLIVVQRPTFTEPVPRDAVELHDAPFLARESIR